MSDAEKLRRRALATVEQVNEVIAVVNRRPDLIVHTVTTLMALTVQQVPEVTWERLLFAARACPINDLKFDRPT